MAAFQQLHDKGASEIPLFSDGNHPDAWPRHTDMPTDYRATGINPHMQRVFMSRHGKAVNIAFLDGHAETVPLANLWQLRWSKVFQRKTVTLP
jgi:prepilin-type processing-associated H-X9-DG protein